MTRKRVGGTRHQALEFYSVVLDQVRIQLDGTACEVKDLEERVENLEQWIRDALDFIQRSLIRAPGSECELIEQAECLGFDSVTREGA